MEKSIFEFAEKFGYESSFEDWLPKINNGGDNGYKWAPSNSPKVASPKTSPTYRTTPTPITGKEISFFKSMLINGIKNLKSNTSILDRMLFFRDFYNTFRPYVPNTPAVSLVDNFINRNKLGIESLSVSDQTNNSEFNSSFLYDIRRMPEIVTISSKYKTFYLGQIIIIDRNLGGMGEAAFIMDFVQDIFKNSTRALLGSFTGTATVAKITDSFVLMNVVIKNQLNWESLTRLPPSFGGYSAENTDTKSLVPLLPSWALDMEFKIRITVNI